MLSSQAIRAWSLLIFSLLLAALAIWQGADITLWLAILFFFALGLLDFCTISLSRKNMARDERRRRERRQRQMEEFTTQRTSIEQMLHAGQLQRLEEWWEDDEFWIDENAHILFIFKDGKEMDFVLHDTTAREISQLLAAQGILWQVSYRAKADARIIWPQ